MLYRRTVSSAIFMPNFKLDEFMLPDTSPWPSLFSWMSGRTEPDSVFELKGINLYTGSREYPLSSCTHASNAGGDHFNSGQDA